ncbi:hypothetical protein [Streptomyces sp. SUK 48]|uniref:hypothetical protein n=1 Tax=Streptomyces sp. SUK 48 TaxID=2582831 RepID=UPI00129B38BA|nr:hypothetical protein [Streptomyces sp. SUK 48]
MPRTRIAPLAAAGAAPPAASASTGTAPAADEGDVVVRRTEPTLRPAHHVSYGRRELHRGHPAPAGGGLRV